MYRHLVFGVLLLISSSIDAQHLQKKSTMNKKTYVIETTVGNKDSAVVKPFVIDSTELTKPYYGDGMYDLYMFIKDNIRAETPVINKAPKGTYKVKVQVVIFEDSSLHDIKPLTSFGYGMEEEAVRVIRLTKKWSPALMGAKPIKYTHIQTITFVVE